jgi:hypothetical protein
MEIKAKDIVGASDGDVSFATAGKWLKSASPSIAVKYALMYFRLKLASAGISSQAPQKPSLSTPPARKVKGSYAGREVEFDEPVVKLEADKSPKVVKAQVDVLDAAFRGNSSDPEMTYIKKEALGVLRVTVEGKRWDVPVGVKAFRVFGKVYQLADLREL